MTRNKVKATSGSKFHVARAHGSKVIVTLPLESTTSDCELVKKVIEKAISEDTSINHIKHRFTANTKKQERIQAAIKRATVASFEEGPEFVMRSIPSCRSGLDPARSTTGHTVSQIQVTIPNNLTNSEYSTIHEAVSKAIKDTGIPKAAENREEVDKILAGFVKDYDTFEERFIAMAKRIHALEESELSLKNKVVRILNTKSYYSRAPSWSGIH